MVFRVSAPNESSMNKRLPRYMGSPMPTVTQFAGSASHTGSGATATSDPHEDRAMQAAAAARHEAIARATGIMDQIPTAGTRHHVAHR
jgi:hypothetical protein